MTVREYRGGDRTHEHARGREHESAPAEAPSQRENRLRDECETLADRVRDDARAILGHVETMERAPTRKAFDDARRAIAPLEQRARDQLRYPGRIYMTRPNGGIVRESEQALDAAVNRARDVVAQRDAAWASSSATIDLPPAYSETRATLAVGGDARASAAEPSPAPDRGAATGPARPHAGRTIDAPPAYAETRATIDLSPAGVAARDARTAARSGSPRAWEGALMAALSPRPGATDADGFRQRVDRIRRILASLPDEDRALAWARLSRPADPDDELAIAFQSKLAAGTRMELLDALGGGVASQSAASIDAPPRFDGAASSTIAVSGAAAPPQIQRKDSAGASLSDDATVDTAMAGVSDATAPLPHLEAIQASFGHHDVSGVRAQVGGAGAAAADAIGAEAYAIGQHVAFAHEPDLHTAAHEAAHTIQQRAGVSLRGGVGQAGDAHERQADEVADAVVAGRSAEPILDRATAGREPAPTTAVQRKPGPTLVRAAEYLEINARELAAAIDAHLRAVAWIEPNPRLPWSRRDLFGAALVEALGRFLGNFTDTTNLRQLCHPANPLALIDQMRPMQAPEGPRNLWGDDDARARGPVGPSDWRPSIGTAIAQTLERAIVASLRRLGPRWVACADRGMSEEARLDDTRSLVPYDALLTSHPIDRIVGRAMTGPAVFAFQEDPARAKQATDDPSAPGPRRVTLHWQGERDPSLWNWVRAEPADATAEEVAASLFAHSETKYGERTTFLAYLLTAAPPLFGVPPNTAIGFPEAKRHAPADGKDGGHEERVLAAASSAVANELALHQGGDEALPRVGEGGPKATLRDLVAGNQLQLQYLISTLTPWGLAEPVGFALGFILGKQGELMAEPDADLAAWARVLGAQRSNLHRIGAGVRQVAEKASELGIADPASPDAAPLRDILAAYARAAGTSHLADTSRALIDEAAGKQAGLALLAVQGSARGLDGALDQLRLGVAEGDSYRGGYLREGAELQEQSVALQSRLIAGEAVPPEQMEQFTLQADMLALRAKVRAATVQLDALEQAAHAAGNGLAAELAAAMSSDFRGIEGTCARMRATINLALTHMDWESAPPAYYPGVVEGESTRRQREIYNAGPRNPRESLQKADATFREIAGNEEFVKFLRQGASLVEWQTFRTACVQVAALVGISIVGSAAAGVVGDAVGGMMMRAGAAESVAELSLGARFLVGGAKLTTDAAINAAGQTAVLNQSLSDGMLENLLISAGTGAILGSLERSAQRAAQLEEAAASVWQKVGRGAKVVLKESAAITGHGILGAGLGYVSHLLVTSQSQPPPATLREWFLQGASIAVGRYVQKAISARMDGLRQMSRADARAELLYKQGRELQQLAERVEAKPEAADALELLNKRHQALVEELRLLESMLQDDAALSKAKLSRYDVFEMQAQIEAQLTDVHAAGGADIALHLSGLEELVPGAVWRGTREQIETAIDSARRQSEGTRRKVDATRDEATGKWDVSIDGRKIEVHERAATGPAGDTAPKPAAPGKRVVLAGDDAELRAAAEWLEPLPGTLDVVVHGTVDDVYVNIDGGRVHLDHRRLALYIKKSGGKYDSVRLAACRSGAHAKGVAQHLANKLGIEVLAPTDTLFLADNGAHVIGPKETRNTGRWETFTPKKSELRSKPVAEAEPKPTSRRRPNPSEDDTQAARADEESSTGDGAGAGAPAVVEVGGRNAAGRARWPDAASRLDSYQPPPPGKSVVEIRERLMEDARALYPDDKSASGEQQAARHHEQVRYFERVEELARSRREDLEAELADAPPERVAALRGEIEGARATEAAAKVRPAQGRLPINHQFAGSSITVADLEARLADPNLRAGARRKLEAARDLMVATGRQEVRFLDNGYVDLRDWTYVHGGGRAEYPGPLSGRNRAADDALANAWFRDRVNDPTWSQPDDHTWHHLETIGGMILVPSTIHDAFRHTGGIPLYRVLTGDYDAY